MKTRLRSFVDLHYDRLWRVLRRLGVPPDRVDDAAQEVLVVFSKRLNDVSSGAEWAFAYAIARRVASEGRRKDSTRPESDGDRALHHLVDPRASAALTLSDERQLLDRLLDALPDEQREALVLIELEGMTMSEAAEMIDVPQGTVASRLRRARAHLERTAEDMRANLQKEGWSV